MQSTTQYEQLIAEKLDQVPVPDMADSIWAGIEAQLDAVVDTPPESSSAFNWKGKAWYGFGGIAIIAAAIWWYSQSANPVTPVSIPKPAPTEHSLPATEQPAPDSHSVISQPQQDLSIHQKDTVELPSESILNPVADSVPARYLPLMTIDSVTLPVTHPAKPYLQPDTVVLPPAPKKPKGVKGITSDDYKIAVDKDSVKKTNQ